MKQQFMRVWDNKSETFLTHKEVFLGGDGMIYLENGLDPEYDGDNRFLRIMEVDMEDMPRYELDLATPFRDSNSFFIFHNDVVEVVYEGGIVNRYHITAQNYSTILGLTELKDSIKKVTVIGNVRKNNYGNVYLTA